MAVLERAIAAVRGLLARAGRERRLTRREQLSVVMVGHLGIFFSALVIQAAFLGSALPTGFIVGEGLIVGLCGFLTIRVPALQSYASQAAEPKRDHPAPSAEHLAEKKKAEGVAGIVLIGAFLVQFGALAFLLSETGGPIESPFAEMTLAIAVFTPFIANEPKTVLSVVGVSIAYYAILIFWYSETHPKPKTVVGLNHPSVWSYFWVNVLILLGAIAFTIYESLAHNRQMAAMSQTALSSEKGSNGSGNGSTPTESIEHEPPRRGLDPGVEPPQ